MRCNGCKRDVALLIDEPPGAVGLCTDCDAERRRVRSQLDEIRARIASLIRRSDVDDTEELLRGLERLSATALEIGQPVRIEGALTSFLVDNIDPDGAQVFVTVVELEEYERRRRPRLGDSEWNPDGPRLAEACPHCAARPNRMERHEEGGVTVRCGGCGLEYSVLPFDFGPHED